VRSATSRVSTLSFAARSRYCSRVSGIKCLRPLVSVKS
jgi:hypothetical protein